MPINPAQAQLLEEMWQRELQIKRRQRATDAVLFRKRRFTTVLLAITGLVAALVATLVIFEILRRTLDRVGWWPLGIVVVLLFAYIGVRVGRSLLGTNPGARLLAIRERQLRERYASDLNSGRRWAQFYYKGEDIAAYVPQILYFLESDPRFTTIDEALAFVKEHRRANALLVAQAQREFATVANATNLAVVSSVDAAGTPSSRLMRFVKTDRPGVWYASTTADGPKVAEFDLGKVALVTLPTPAGGSISSNRIEVTRAPFMLDSVADMYEEQVPGYLEGVTLAEQRRELVYVIKLQSARVDTWLDQDVVEFPDGD